MHFLSYSRSLRSQFTISYFHLQLYVDVYLPLNLPKKITGPDIVYARVIKVCLYLWASSSTIDALCPVFYQSAPAFNMERGARCPNLKARSRLSPKNYHPISLLSIQSKVMESIVSKSLTKFLESNDILFKVHISFHWGLGTNDLLTLLPHVWSHVSGFGGFAHVLAVDIASDFDKISYVGALHKAKGCGACGPVLLKLTSCVNGHVSELLLLVNNRPHGSRFGFRLLGCV